MQPRRTTLIARAIASAFLLCTPASCAEPAPQGDIVPEPAPRERAPRPQPEPPGPGATPAPEPVFAVPPGPSDDLPLGRWTAGISELCVDVMPNRIIRISVKSSPTAREPDVIEASYHATRTAADAWRLVLDVRSIHRKTLGRCRQRWVDAPLEQSAVLGVEMRPGQRAAITLRLTAERRTLEVCGAAGACRELEGRTTERRCRVFGRNVFLEGFADPFVRAGTRGVLEDDDHAGWPSSRRTAPEDATGTVVARDVDGFEATCGELR